MPTPEDPSIRTLRARLAAHTSWANTADRSARTKKGRQGAEDRFLREVDPDGTLDPAEAAKRASNARKAFYTRLQLRSAKSRKRKAEVRRRTITARAVPAEPPADPQADTDG